jgi:hypothetical protein
VALFDPAILDAFAGEVVHADHAGEEPGVSVPRDTMSSRAPAAAAQGR